MGIFLNALGAIALGAVGWFTLEFLGRPIREFFNIRREIRRLMLVHWDDATGDNLSAADFAKLLSSLAPTRQEFTTLAARLDSFDQAELASWIIRRLGFDIPKAAGCLRRVGVSSARREDRDANFRNLDIALHFRSEKRRNI